MSWLLRRTTVLVALALLAAVALVTTPRTAAHAGPPGKWTKIAVTTGFANQVAMLRTRDGRLHLVWQEKAGASAYRYRTAAVTQSGQLGKATTVLTGWGSLEGDPRLVPDGKGLRLVFIGVKTDNPGDFFSRGAVYTATSSNGTAWSLVNGSMASHTVLNLGLAAAAETDGTPVATFGLNSSLYFHRGVDASSPAATPDSAAATGQVSTGLESSALVRAKDGSIWLAWYQLFGSKQGYYVRKLLPTQGTVTRVPQSGRATRDNSPGGQVAFASRAGGGLYVAYCVPTSRLSCAHVALWRVGTARPKTVPGTGSGSVRSVALVTGPRGRLTAAWYDSSKNLIRAARTDTTATRFGTLRSIRPPSRAAVVEGLQVQGSSGRLDVVLNVLAPTGDYEFWHTQILPGLRLTARPHVLSRSKATRVTFKVTDAGQAVRRAAVSCLGRHGRTGAHGTVAIRFPSGLPTGRHVCAAKRTGYNPAKVTVRVS